MKGLEHKTDGLPPQPRAGIVVEPGKIRPANGDAPRIGDIKPGNQVEKVDFPTPDSPRMATISPGATARSRPANSAGHRARSWRARQWPAPGEGKGVHGEGHSRFGSPQGTGAPGVWHHGLSPAGALGLIVGADDVVGSAMTIAPALAVLGAAVLLGGWLGIRYLMGERNNRVLVGLHLILGIAGLEVLMLLLRGAPDGRAAVTGSTA